MKTKFGLIATLAVLLVGSVFSSAQTAGGITAAKQQNLILLNGRPQLLLWARGVQDPQDLPAYKQAGFTALYVAITASDESLAQAKALLAAAQTDGLPVMVGIDSRGAQFDSNGGATISVNPASGDYQFGVQSFLAQVVDELGNSPNVIAWIVEGLTPSQLPYSTPDYQLWLQSQYQNIGELNNSWQSNFTDLQAITLDNVADTDAALPGGLGRATLSVGLYYKSRYQQLLSLWGDTLKRLNPNRMLILGDQQDFRSLMATGEPFAGPVTAAYGLRPSAFGGWEGIEAIDMARQGNRFAAFAFADVRSGVSGGTLYDWAGQALVHGAAGLGLDNWESIKAKPDLTSAITQIKARFIATGAFPQTPRAETAFIYVPLAGGPDYGFLPQAASAEPKLLFQTFARGTRFGLVDYLSEDRLAQTDLSRYKTLFAPLAFAVSADSQTALADYVQKGGILAADWGFAANDGGSLNNLPETISQLFGVGVIIAYTRTPLNLTVVEADDLFPSLPLQAMTSGAAEGGAFSDLVGAVNLTTAKRFMSIEGFEFYVPSIVINRTGAGAAVFVSAPLWENWRRGDDLFEGFHYDLLNRNPSLEVAQAGLFPEADITFYQSNGFGIYRPSDLTAPTQVRSGAIGNQGYFLSSGYQILGSDPVLVFSGGGGNFARPLALQYNPNTLAYLQVKEYGAKRLALEIHGANPTITSEGGKVSLNGGGPFLLSLTLGREGLYDFAPGSRHRLTLQPLTGGPATTQELVASEGTLQINLSGLAMTATLEPME